MNDALKSVKLQNARLNKDLQKRAEQRKIKKIEKAAVKERKKIEKEEKKLKDREEGKLTRTQSVKKYVTDKANKAYYGNFQEKYISIYGKGNSDKNAKYGTVWKQIYSVRKDYVDNDDDNMEQDQINNKLEQAGVNVESVIDPESAEHIKNGEIRQKNIIGKDYIIIPYKNSNLIYDLLIKGELDENTVPEDYNVREFEEGEYIIQEQIEKGLIYYNFYIPVVIKEHVRFAKIMKYHQDKENSNEKERKKAERDARIEANNKERNDIIDKLDEIMKSINSVNDILDDNELLSFPPCKKISQAYCYIHPINVILYDKTIEYGLIWRKNNNVLSNADIVYVNINDFFGEKNTDSLDTFNVFFREAKEKSEDKDLIDLSKYEEIVKLTKEHDFSQGNIYYQSDDGSTYVCEPTKFDYKYKQGSFDKEEYFKTLHISGNLKNDKENIEASQKTLDENILKVIDEAGKNIAFNKVKTYDRQKDSDALTQQNQNNAIYWLSYVFIGYLKYIQDVFYAGIKTLFSSRWNNVMTGFVILIFIIILIIVGISAGEEDKNEGPNKKPKEENKDFLAVITSIPTDMNNIYNSAIKLSSDVGNMMSNSRRTVNDIADAITGDDNSDDIDRPYIDDGRGGDNFIHFNNGIKVDSIYSMNAKQIDPRINNINYDKQPQLETINNTITLDAKHVSVNAGEAQMFVPDCTSNIYYFDNNCKLIEHDPDSKVVIDKDSDYEQIKINDKTK
jgi:hypothetical protein